MGFQVARRARLTFDAPYEGAEVQVRLDLPLHLYLDIEPLVNRWREDRAAAEELAANLAEHIIVEWNLTDEDDRPLPIEAGVVYRLPPVLFSRVLSGWVEAILGVAAPLGRQSPNGATSEAATTATGTG